MMSAGLKNILPSIYVKAMEGKTLSQENHLTERKCNSAN